MMDRESSSPHPFQSSIDRLSQQGDVIFQSELIGVILTNKQKILWANSYIEKVLGKNHAELGKSSINGLFVSRQEYLQIAKSALDEINRENVYRVTIRLKDKNNHPIWLNASGRLLDEHSQEVVWVMVNITPQKIAEARLIEAVRVAEETNRAKSQLLATVSHEIRTPMTAIIGLSKLGMQQQDPENLSKYLTKIHDSSESLIRTLDQSLDLTKIENGKLDIESRPFQIDAVLADLQGLFKGASETKGLLFDCTLDSADPIVLNGDMHRIRQVLINLIGNAIKFTSKGKVKLSVICQKIDRNHAGINFIVADTGIGIKESEIKELIKPYNQANISIARIYGGSGLGLLICNQILALMNSQLEIKSVPNLGSTFSFTLKLPYLNKPEGLAEKELITSPESIESQLVNMPILVVEDNLVVQEMIGEFLTLSGAKVDIASNGLEALQLLSKKTYAAVLMDTQMPVMDGLTTAIQIRKHEHLKHLPIIGLSAGISPKERDACLASGMNDFLSKPFKPMQLVAHLKSLIEKTPFNPILSGANILLVDDNLLIQQTLSELLTLSGAQVDMASNGIEALQLLSKKTYAAVLMDTQMPVMDGLTTAIQIRQLEHLKHLPIIGLSGGINPKDREACLASGMNDFVAKNTDTANLVKVLSNLISQNKSVSGIQSNQKINAVEIDYSQALPGFNPKVIETLKQNKVFERIASLFYQQTSEVMNEIDQIIHQNDIDALQQKIHYFKSSAAAIGADDLFKKTVDFDDAIGSIDSSIPLGKQLGEENIPYKEFKSALLNVRQLMGSI
jgi:CheY-like chemotaxis protein/signal transduction histidine kinase